MPHQRVYSTISPGQYCQDGPLCRTNCRATILSRAKSRNTRARGTGCSLVAIGPLAPTQLSWVPSVAELTFSVDLAAPALPRPTTQSSGTTNLENHSDFHPTVLSASTLATPTAAVQATGCAGTLTSCTAATDVETPKVLIIQINGKNW